MPLPSDEEIDRIAHEVMSKYEPCLSAPRDISGVTRCGHKACRFWMLQWSFSKGGTEESLWQILAGRLHKLAHRKTGKN